MARIGMMRRGWWALGLAAMAAACATDGPRGPFYSVTAYARIDSTQPARTARRAAIALAERQARDQLMTMIYQLRLSDGRLLENLAVVDPFVRAAIEDAVRRAAVVDRTVDDEGLVTLTLRMELAPLYRLIEDYAKHPI